MRIILVTLGMALMASSASAQTVHDGDTFLLGDDRVRLWGVDAPEAGQTCVRDGETINVGDGAAAVLDVLLENLDACRPMGTDPDGDIIARCYTTDGDDIGAMMVAAGVAWEVRQHSDGYYTEQEVEAREDGLGNWGMDCMPPWEWRQEN